MFRLTSASGLDSASGSYLGQNWDMDVFTSIDMDFITSSSWGMHGAKNYRKATQSTLMLRISLR